jgi:amino acid adenylation domain-containing protein
MDYLPQILEASAELYPEHTALEDLNGGKINYRELNKFSNKIRDELLLHGICPGDRVGIYSHKSIDMVASIFGVLKSGAAYVPVDPGSPRARNAFIFNDCLVKFILIEKEFLKELNSEWKDNPSCVLKELTDQLLLIDGPGKSSAEPQNNAGSSELAYILYTSGSTGNPKGVMYSHKGALAFVNWCSETFELNDQDVFSSHAPFHFDLSIFDLYVSLKHGGSIILIGEEAGKQPMVLAELISARRISVWYSTPSILTLIVKYGKIQKYDYPNLKLVLFAGEVFPLKHLEELMSIWKHPRYFNLYGPTETNVCTYYEIPRVIPSDQTTPFPIGKSCSHLICKAFDENCAEVESGQEGELCVTGPIMSGYWNLPERTAKVFFSDKSGNLWYKTGDIVRKQTDGNYIYISRKDRMVKRRGYRVELGEIESAFHKHPSVVEVAVVALQDEEGGVLIKAFLNIPEKEHASVIKMKQFAVENLPNYMIPDRFVFLPSLPKTSTDKIDYQKLKAL